VAITIVAPLATMPITLAQWRSLIAVVVTRALFPAPVIITPPVVPTLVTPVMLVVPIMAIDMARLVTGVMAWLVPIGTVGVAVIARLVAINILAMIDVAPTTVVTRIALTVIVIAIRNTPSKTQTQHSDKQRSIRHGGLRDR